jgi:hypothetical protein
MPSGNSLRHDVEVSRTHDRPQDSLSRSDVNLLKPAEIRAISSAIRGIAEILIEADVPAETLEYVAKREFVRAAARQATRRSGSINQSTVAAITGVPRQEIKRLLQDSHDALGPKQKLQSRAVRVVNGWTQDTQFLTRSGRPRVLSLSSSANGFASLVRRYAGDIPPRAMLTRLLALGMVKTNLHAGTGDTKISLVPVRTAPAVNVSRLKYISSIAQILSFRSSTRHSPTALSAEIPVGQNQSLPAALRMLKEKGLTFLNGMSSANRLTQSERSTDTISVILAISARGHRDKRKVSRPR